MRQKGDAMFSVGLDFDLFTKDIFSLSVKPRGNSLRHLSMSDPLEDSQPYFISHPKRSWQF